MRRGAWHFTRQKDAGRPTDDASVRICRRTALQLHFLKRGMKRVPSFEAVASFVHLNDGWFHYRRGYYLGRGRVKYRVVHKSAGVKFLKFLILIGDCLGPLADLL